MVVQLHPLLEKLVLLAPCMGAISNEGVVADIGRWDVELHIAVSKSPRDEADDGVEVRWREALEDRGDAHGSNLAAFRKVHLAHEVLPPIDERRILVQDDPVALFPLLIEEGRHNVGQGDGCAGICVPHLAPLILLGDLLDLCKARHIGPGASH